ncbi:hypothetical protein THAOC_33831 [Thalassiosira oceanica]|uniref:Uncharacterized protein n=1 Tax=Thalassiosira oceanica TaxID=159749 RepID=K0RL70_THAOC|nr:hypothetical protein THAOC_33831 [Thalassiosira oceanica]|eukprot:EJK47447.1 hypothetical protein THAOC_33831 [Thalassiosira oceanica]
MADDTKKSNETVHAHFLPCGHILSTSMIIQEAKARSSFECAVSFLFGADLSTTASSLLDQFKSSLFEFGLGPEVDLLKFPAARVTGSEDLPSHCSWSRPLAGPSHPIPGPVVGLSAVAAVAAVAVVRLTAPLIREKLTLRSLSLPNRNRRRSDETDPSRTATPVQLLRPTFRQQLARQKLELAGRIWSHETALALPPQVRRRLGFILDPKTVENRNAGQPQTKSTEVVVSRFDEDISWLNVLDFAKMDVTVYNKGPSVDVLGDGVEGRREMSLSQTIHCTCHTVNQDRTKIRLAFINNT